MRIYGTEVPIPPLVISKPKSAAGKELVRLHAEAEERTRIVHSLRRAHREAMDEVREAEAAFGAELDRSAQSGERDAPTEVALARKVEDARMGAGDSFHLPRIEKAIALQNQAVAALHTQIQANVADLLGELRGDAERATAELAEAQAAMAPHLAAYHEVAERVNTLTASVHRYQQAPPQNRFAVGQPVALDTHDRWVLPPGVDAVPMPDAAVVAEWDRRFHPERYEDAAADVGDDTEAAA